MSDTENLKRKKSHQKVIGKGVREDQVSSDRLLGPETHLLKPARWSAGGPADGGHLALVGLQCGAADAPWQTPHDRQMPMTDRCREGASHRSGQGGGRDRLDQGRCFPLSSALVPVDKMATKRRCWGPQRAEPRKACLLLLPFWWSGWPDWAVSAPGCCLDLCRLLDTSWRSLHRACLLEQSRQLGQGAGSFSLLCKSHLKNSGLWILNMSKRSQHPRFFFLRGNN